MYDNMFYNILMNKKSGVFQDMLKTYGKAKRLLDSKLNSDMSKTRWYNQTMSSICQILSHDVKGLKKDNWPEFLESSKYDMDYELIRQIARLSLAMGLNTSREHVPENFKSWAKENATSEHTAHTLSKQTQFYAKMVIDGCLMLMDTKTAPMSDNFSDEELDDYLKKEFGITLDNKNDA